MPSFNKKLLLIEDNSRLREKIISIVEPLVQEIVIANNGIEGFLAYNKHLPHILILEQFLPDISGEELVWRWRQKRTPQQLPILMIASSRFGELSTGLYQMLNHLLPKPLSSQKLRDALVYTLQETQHTSQPVPYPTYNNAQSFYTFRGFLKQTSFLRLIHRIQQESLTGVLTLQLQEGQRNMSFWQGELTYAESQIHDEQFSALLHQRFPGVDQESFEQVFAGSGGRACLQKEALDRLEAIHPPDLELTYNHYIREIVIRSFFTREGTYAFTEDCAYVQRTSGEALSYLPLLYQGIQRHYPEDSLAREFNKYSNFLCKISAKFYESTRILSQTFPAIPLTPQLIDAQPLQRVFEQLSGSIPDARCLLKTLLVADLIQLEAPPTSVVMGEPIPHQESTQPDLSLNKPANTSESTPQEPILLPSMGSHPWEQTPQTEMTSRKQQIGRSGEYPLTFQLTPRQTQERPTIQQKQTHNIPRNPPSNDRITQERPRIRGPHRNTPPFYQAVPQQAPFSHPTGFPISPIPPGGTPLPMSVKHSRHPLRQTQQHMHVPMQHMPGSTPLPRGSMTPNPGADRQAVNKLRAQAQHQYQVGRRSLQAKKYKEAIYHFQRAQELDPTDLRFSLYLGWSIFLESKGNPEKIQHAARLITTALERNTRLVKGHFFLGVIRKFQKQYDRAEYHFNQLAAIEPNNQDVHRHLKEIAQLRMQPK